MPIVLLLLLPFSLARSLGAQGGAPTAIEARALVDSAIAAVERGDGERTLERARRAMAAARPGAGRSARLSVGALERRLYRHEHAAATLAALIEPAAGGSELDAIGVAAAMELAGLHQRQGRITETRVLMERVLRAVAAGDDPVSASDAQIVLAGLALRAGDTGAASAHLALADSIIGDRDARIRARVHCQRAAMLGFGARSAASEEARRGIALAAAAGDRRIEASCELAIGAGFAQRGVADSAMPALTRAVALARDTRDDATLTAALQWRGFLARVLGRPGEAWNDLTASVEAGLRSDTRNPLAWSWLNLGLISLSLRDPASANASLGAAVEEFGRQQDQWGLHSALQVRAGVLAQLGAYESADSAMRRVLEWGRRTGNRATEGDALNQRMALARSRGAHAAARAHLDTLTRLYASPDLRGYQAALAYPRALNALAERRLAEAERLLRTFLPTVRAEQVGLRFAVQARLAEALAMQDRAADAAAALAAAMDELDRQRRTLSDPALRQLVFQSDTASGDAEMGVATVIGRVATAGSVEVAFDLAERRRARELADRMLRLAAVTGPASAPSGRGATPVALAGLQETLRAADAAALVYVAGRPGEAMTLFVVTGLTASAVRLVAADSIDGIARRTVGLLESTGAAPRPMLQALHALLVAPAVAHLPPGIMRLVIVPEGPVHRVPFAALEDGAGVALATHHAVSVVPSATVLAGLRRLPARTDPVRMLALGDPMHDFSATSPSAAVNQLRQSFRDAGATGELPGARREVRRVARFAPTSDVLTGRRATVGAIRDGDPATYRVIHVAGHAVVDDGSPMRTAIALAPDGDDLGFLTAADLADTRLAADLVVLSACRTARGMLVDGEGEQGLATALLAAGVRAVVASHWAVRDDATARFMEDMYTALANGEPLTDALAHAQRRSIGRGEPAGVWAAFTVVGDPLAAPSLVSPAGDRLPWVLAALLAAGIGLAVVRRRQGGVTVSRINR